MGKTKKPKKDKKSKKKKHHREKSKKKSSKNSDKVDTKTNAQCDNYDIPLELMSSKTRAPETQEEYKKRQSRIRYEVDPVTGRRRLIRGDGEVLEEIVSRKRHVEINKKATDEDGKYFRDNTTGKN